MENYKNFLDLGSGDGRVVLIASLFTKAKGFEADKHLNNLAKKARKELKLDAEFENRNYFEENWKKYGAIFIYSSKTLNEKFKNKILNELKGTLIVYKIYFPNFLKKTISFVDDYLTINCYERE